MAKKKKICIYLLLDEQKMAVEFFAIPVCFYCITMESVADYKPNFKFFFLFCFYISLKNSH